MGQNARSAVNGRPADVLQLVRIYDARAGLLRVSVLLSNRILPGHTSANFAVLEKIID